MQLPFQKSHAFIIGINSYRYVSALQTAVNDAKILAERLKNDHGYIVHGPLIDPDKAALVHYLEHTIKEEVGKEDRVLFYFAGHGIALDSQKGPQGYLAATDTESGKIESLYPMDKLHDTLSSLPCRHGLLVLDCCFSGSFKWSSRKRDIIFDFPDIVYEQRFYQYMKDPAWQVITSAASDQKAVDILENHSLGFRGDSANNHSPFALALLDGITGAADLIPKDKGNGVITTTELYTYLRDRVENVTMSQSKRQTPALFNLEKHDKGQYVFLHPRHRLNLPPAPDRNPFMGLKSYDETDASLFYGRDRVVTALNELIKQQQFVVVSGASGTGKSSVIKAGVLPNLRKAGWTILPIIRPGKEPMVHLKESVPNLTDVLSKDNKTVLIIDQYEELITQCLESSQKEAFEAQLAAWLNDHPSLRIIISVRSDFEPQFEENSLSNWWNKGRYIVPVFSTEELREVIVKPTLQEVLFFEPDSLVEDLVDAVNQAPGALPLLSFTLSELYHAYLESGRTNRALTAEDYEKLGGVIGALRTRADKVYNDLDDAHQNSMRQLMLRMVSLEGGELASKRVLKADLQFTDQKETERVEAVAQQLVAARLVQQGTDTHGAIYIEPAHDALIRAWRRLWEWVKTIGEDKLSWQNKLTVAVRDYAGLLKDNPSKAKQLLWNNNPRLDLLKAELANENHSLNVSETTFVTKSVNLKVKKQRQFTGGLFGIIALLFAASIFSYNQKVIADGEKIIADEQRIVAEDLYIQNKARQRENVIERCNRYVNAGKNFMSVKDYDSAIEEFDRAKQTVKDYQEDLLEKDSTIINESCVTDADVLIQESKDKSGLKKGFDQAITNGDKNVNRNNFLAAREAYQNAIKIGYDPTVARNKYKENEIALTTEYNELITKANTHFTTATNVDPNTKIALTAYKDALKTYEQAILRFPLIDKDQQNFVKCQEFLENKQ